MGEKRNWVVKSGFGLHIMVTALMLFLAVNTAQAADRVEYYHADALGSVMASTDEDGNVLWREAYKPFGERLLKEVSTKDNTPFYTGKPHDDDTGLSYFGARYYAPDIGRFLGVDPVGVDPGNMHSFNRYAYANNNPYAYVDPDGKETLVVGGSIKIPGWLIRLAVPDFLGDGGAFGVAVSYPAGDGAQFDLGVFGSADFVNPDAPGPAAFNLGAKGSLDVGVSKGSVKDLAGINVDMSAHAFGFGLTRNFDEEFKPTGVEVNVGPGINIGGNLSMAAVLSLRNGLVHDGKKDEKPK